MKCNRHIRITAASVVRAEQRPAPTTALGRHRRRVVRRSRKRRRTRTAIRVDELGRPTVGALVLVERSELTLPTGWLRTATIFLDFLQASAMVPK